MTASTIPQAPQPAPSALAGLFRAWRHQCTTARDATAAKVQRLRLELASAERDLAALDRVANVLPDV